MTDFARLAIIGNDTSIENILQSIEKIKNWQGGDGYIYVTDKDENHVFMDLLSNVENAVNGDLKEYINTKLITRENIARQKFDEVVHHVVDHTEKAKEFYRYNRGGAKKYRNPMRHLTPKKKKRK